MNKKPKVFYHHPATEDMGEDLQTVVEQHDKIIAAIEDRDTMKASELIKAHMDLSRRRMAEYVAPVALDLVMELQQ